jgi:cytochrome c
MTRGLGALALILSAGIVAAAPSAAADALTGAQLAGRWCASCHVIGDRPAASVQQGPPSFRTIAQGGLTADQLKTFLSHPHPPMPDLALTRSEIVDLIAYIDTLRARDR